MKYTLAVAATVLAMTASNAGSTSSGLWPSTSGLWKGNIFITTATSACGSVGANAGEFVLAVYAPKEFHNATSDRLALFFPRGAAFQIVPTPAGSLNGATKVNATIINDDAGLYTDNSHPFGKVTISPYPVQAGSL